MLDVAVSGKVQEILKTISADDAKGTRREEKDQGIGELTMDDPADDDEYRNDERKAKFGETTLRTGSLMDQR